jgi:hypothetical protein
MRSKFDDGGAGDAVEDPGADPNISMMLDMLDCGGGEAADGGGEEVPPRISARRSVLVVEGAAGVAAGASIMSRRSCSVGLITLDFLLEAFFLVGAEPSTRDSSLICGMGIFSSTPRRT